MSVGKLLVVALLGIAVGSVQAGEFVSYESVVGDSKVVTQADYSAPSNAVATGSQHKYPAVVLLHSAGGFSDGTTGPMARALNAAGFATLELKFFQKSNSPRPTLEQMTQGSFGAIRYLSSRPEIDDQRVGIAGFSLGAYVTIWTASEWLSKNIGGGLRFAAHAPIYPVCWHQTAWAKGQSATKFPPLSYPKEFLLRFTGAPVKIFAAGKDDYDDRDSNACREFVNAINETDRRLFEIVSYADATHGWNQASQSFYAEAACKGKGF